MVWPTLESRTAKEQNRYASHVNSRHLRTFVSNILSSVTRLHGKEMLSTDIESFTATTCNIHENISKGYIARKLWKPLKRNSKGG